MSAIDTDSVKAGDQVKVRGDRSWLPVITVHEEGVHVMDRASHHWIRFRDVREQRSQQ